MLLLSITVRSNRRCDSSPPQMTHSTTRIPRGKPATP